DRRWRRRIRTGLRLVGQGRVPLRRLRHLYHVHQPAVRRGGHPPPPSPGPGPPLARRHELQVLVRPDQHLLQSPGLSPGALAFRLRSAARRGTLARDVLTHPSRRVAIAPSAYWWAAERPERRVCTPAVDDSSASSPW